MIRLQIQVFVINFFPGEIEVCHIRLISKEANNEICKIFDYSD
jgi:hypothetical protein